MLSGSFSSLAAVMITLLSSAVLLVFFIFTVNRNSTIRLIFRIGHRALWLSFYIAVSLFTVMLIIDFILFVGGLAGIRWISMDVVGNMFDLTIDYGFLSFMVLGGPLNLVCGLTMKIKKITNIQYEKYGLLGEWGEQTRAFKKRIQWIPVVLDKLEPLIKPIAGQKGKLQILAPAANNGEEEYALAEGLADRLHCKIRMRASDLTTMAHRMPVLSPRVEYTYEQANAYELSTMIQTPQDIIYDPKGILWYTQGKEKRLMPALRLFYDLLAPDGLILIDAAIQERKNQQQFNQFKLHFGLQINYYCEQSTYSKIKKAFVVGSAASELFSLEIVDGLEGPYQMAVLRKRPAAEENIIRVG